MMMFWLADPRMYTLGFMHQLVAVLMGFAHQLVAVLILGGRTWKDGVVAARLMHQLVAVHLFHRWQW